MMFVVGRTERRNKNKTQGDPNTQFADKDTAMTTTATNNDWITVGDGAARTGICERQIRNYIYHRLVKFRKRDNTSYLVFWPSLKTLRESRETPFIRRRP